MFLGMCGRMCGRIYCSRMALVSVEDNVEFARSDRIGAIG